jgi:hypothetical protein
MKRKKDHFKFIVIAGLLLVLSSCGSSPTDPPVSGDTRATGHIDPAQTGRFLLGTVETTYSSVPVEVWAQNLIVESDSIVSFDAVIINRCNCPIAAPLHFVIISIVPDVVQVENADIYGRDGPVFDFSDDIGNDGILGPYESSEPVKMKFSWPEPMAFSIGFRVDTGPPRGGAISGIVFNDLNGDGIRSSNEPGIAGIVVDLKPSAREILYRRRADENGHFVFSELTADVYTASAWSEYDIDMRPTTPNPLVITLVELPDGTVSDFDKADFGFMLAPPPPPPPGVPVFGPVDVGPGSMIGTVLDTTFVVPAFCAPVEFFLVVSPPPILAPYPIWIDMASVEIDSMVVWEFVCDHTDTLSCLPSAKVPLDLSLPGSDDMERNIRIITEGNDWSFLMYSIIAEHRLDLQ